MKSYLLLLKVNLLSLLGHFRGASLRKDNGKLDVSRIILYITAALGVLVLAGMVIFLEVMLYRAVAGLGLEKLVIGLALLLLMVVTLLFGVFHTLGSMYFNRDTAGMAYLPLSSRTHMAAKWMEIYLCEVLFSVSLLLPLLICHGVFTGAGVLYYIGSVLVVLATPLYPLAISLLLASLLGRISSLTRHKELWVVLGTIVLLAVVLGAEWMLLPSIPEDADAMFFVRLLMSNEALVNFLIGAFPPVMWGVNAVDGSIPMLALYVLAGVAAIFAVIWVMGRSYLKVCLLHTEQGTRKKRARSRGEISFESRSPFRAIFQREMNEVLRTPVYLLNAVLGVLMMPIMLLGMSVGLSAGEESVMLTQVLDELLGMLSPLDLTLILAALFSFMCLICPISATAVSREGKRLPIMCMIPVAPKTILTAKLMVNLAFIIIGLVIMAGATVVLLGTAYLPHVLCAALLADLLSYAASVGNLTVDVLRPVLEWKNETEVMKQNMNTMFGMLVSVIMIALPVAAALLMLALPAWTRMAAVCAMILAEAGACLLLMRFVTEPRFARLEP